MLNFKGIRKHSQYKGSLNKIGTGIQEVIYVCNSSAQLLWQHH